MKTVAVFPRQYFFGTYGWVKIVFLGVLSSLLLSLVFSVLFFTIEKKSKDMGKPHITDRKPSLAYTGIVFAILCLVLLVVLLFRFVGIFGWVSAWPLYLMVMLGLGSVALFVSDLIFLYRRECTDPDKFLNAMGQCVCRGSLFQQKNGSCGCPKGSERSGVSCLGGCKTGSDCDSGICSKDGNCCAKGFISCGGNCCDPLFCKNGVCCAPERQCGSSCCLPEATCDTQTKTCVVACGPFKVPQDKICFETTGDPETLKGIGAGLAAQKIQYTIDESKETLYAVFDRSTCSFDPDIGFTPPSVSANGVVFYPCLPTNKYGEIQESDLSKKNPGLYEPLQYNICVPSGDASSSLDQYQTCWERLRPVGKPAQTLEKCLVDTKCELNNYANLDYFKDINQAIKTRQALIYAAGGEDLNAPSNVSYQGNFCGSTTGNAPGSVKILSQKITGPDCTTPQQKSLFCLQNGGFSNARIVVNRGDVCNTIIDCDADPGKPSLKNYKINGSESAYSAYKGSQEEKVGAVPKEAYIYLRECPTLAPLPKDSGIWPDDQRSKFVSCPENLAKIQTKGSTGKEGETDYASFLCSPTGKLYFGKTNEQSYYTVDASKYDPVYRKDQFVFAPHVGICGNGVWNGDPATIKQGICITEDQKKQIQNVYLPQFEQNAFINNQPPDVYRFWVGDVEIFNKNNSFVSAGMQGRTFNGGFLRTVDASRADAKGENVFMISQTNVITDQDDIVYLNDDNVGHPFSALSIMENGGVGCVSIYGNCDAGSNNYCDPKKQYYLNNRCLWNLEFTETPNTDVAIKIVEAFTRKKFLVEKRAFQMRSTQTSPKPLNYIYRQLFPVGVGDQEKVIFLFSDNQPSPVPLQFRKQTQKLFAPASTSTPLPIQPVHRKNPHATPVWVWPVFLLPFIALAIGITLWILFQKRRLRASTATK